MRTALDYAADFGLTWPGEITEEARYAFGTAAPLMTGETPSCPPCSPSCGPCNCRIISVSMRTVTLVDTPITVTITGLNLRNIQLRGHGLEIISGPSGDSTLQHAEVMFKHPGATSLSATCESNSEAATVYISAHQFKIMWNNLNVTNGDLGLVVVGQKVTLDAVWQPTTPPGVTYEWTAPEKCIGDYQMPIEPELPLVPAGSDQRFVTVGKITKLEHALVTLDNGTQIKRVQHQKLEFYPTGVMTDAEVRLKVKVTDQNAEATCKISVIAPFSSLTGTVSNLENMIYLDGTKLRCGNNDTEQWKGIRFRGSTSGNSLVEGTLGLIQLIRGQVAIGNKITIFPNRQGFIGTSYNTNGVYVLDRDAKPGEGPFYKNTTATIQIGQPGLLELSDSPYNSDGSTFQLETYADQAFETYLMFQPTGGIWVTLRKLTWRWKGHAKRTEAQDILLLIDSETVSPALPGSVIESESSQTLPVWSELMNNLKKTNNLP